MTKSTVHEAGQALVETLAAIAVAAIVVIALLSLGVSSLRGAGVSKDEIEAVRLMNEGKELIRNFRDNKGFYELASYDSSCGSASSECSVSASGDVINPYPETIGKFERYFYMDYTNGDGYMKIFVNVRWVEGAKERVNQGVTILAEWYKESP